MSRLVAQALANLMQTLTPFHGPTTTRSTSLCLCWGFGGFVLPAMQPADPDPKHLHPGKCTAESEAWSYSRRISHSLEAEWVWGLCWLPNATPL